MKKYLVLCVSFLLAGCSGGLDVKLSANDVLESSSPGTFVGKLSVASPQDGVTYTYSLLNDADGAFKIVGNQLVVANGTKLDFEDEETKTVQVKVVSTDDGSGDKEFTIDVKNIKLEVTNLNNNGTGSLRKVIQDADSGSTIGFKSTLHGTIEIDSQILIQKKLTIVGPGSSVITIDGQNMDQIFYIAAGGNVTVSGLTFERGGGALVVEFDAKLNVSNAVFKNNSGGFGGAIDSSGEVTIDHCLFTQNDAFNGGAIGVSGDTLIINSSIYNNATTGNSGGGLVMVGGEVTIVNTTFSDNSVSGANRVGGAIACVLDTATPVMNLYNVTITDNHADVMGGQGGGIFAEDCDMNIRNSIIANNTATSDGPDIYLGGAAEITSGGYNLIGSRADNTFTDGSHHDQVGSSGSPLDPGLTDLASNDDTTKSHALKSTSLALDQIPAASCKDQNGDTLTTDQRGQARPVNEKCDIGAFEAQ